MIIPQGLPPPLRVRDRLQCDHKHDLLRKSRDILLKCPAVTVPRLRYRAFNAQFVPLYAYACSGSACAHGGLESCDVSPLTDILPLEPLTADTLPLDWSLQFSKTCIAICGRRRVPWRFFPSLAVWMTVTLPRLRIPSCCPKRVQTRR